MEEIRGRITKRDITLPEASDQGKLAFILDDVFTKEECNQFIERTEKGGYVQALLNVGLGREVLRTDVRNGSRHIWDAPDVAEDWYQRIKDFLPPKFKEYDIVGLNERLRFLKYTPGGYFRFHCDGSYMREDGSGEKSFITVLLYLNDGYKGGSTTFVKIDNVMNRQGVMPGDVESKIKPGSVLVFQHNILHEGSLLIEGTKYTVRTDVMYRPPDTES